jgi:hypothetical protein
MALHCAATFLLVPAGGAVEEAADGGAVVAEPLAPGTDVVDALQALADLHRGERVVVPVTDDQVAAALEHLGRSAAGVGSGRVVRLEVGDDGWALIPGELTARHPAGAADALRRGGARSCRPP